MKTFANISDLLKKSTNKRLYIELSNGYFAPISKKDIKHIAKTMEKNESKFCGEFLSDEVNFLQIKIA